MPRTGMACHDFKRGDWGIRPPRWGWGTESFSTCVTPPGEWVGGFSKVGGWVVSEWVRASWVSCLLSAGLEKFEGILPILGQWVGGR